MIYSLSSFLFFISLKNFTLFCSIFDLFKVLNVISVLNLSFYFYKSYRIKKKLLFSFLSKFSLGSLNKILAINSSEGLGIFFFFENSYLKSLIILINTELLILDFLFILLKIIFFIE